MNNEHLRIYLAAAGAWCVTLTQIETGLKIAVLLATLVYTVTKTVKLIRKKD